MPGILGAFMAVDPQRVPEIPASVLLRQEAASVPHIPESAVYIRIQARLFLWLLATTVAIAQTGDTRISPPVPLVPSLPESARMQSAAAIGEHTLAVWGTSRTGKGDTVHNQLRAVIIHDSTVAGEPFVVGSEDASPAGYVRVLSLADRFMVFWRDVRDGAPGLYAQRFTPGGIALGGESLVDSGMIDTAGRLPVEMFGTPEKGYAVLWNVSGPGMSDRTGYRRIGPAGEYIGEPVRFGMYLGLAAWGTALPGMLLGSLGDGRGVIIHDDGRLDIGRFNGSSIGWESRDGESRRKRYHLSADTSFALLSDTTLRLYRSLFDTLPRYTIQVPELREARFQSPLITRDSAGGYSLYYAVLHSSSARSAVIYFHHIGITSQGERGPADLRDSLVISSYERPYLLDSGSYEILCDNSRYHTFTFSYWVKDWYYPILHEVRPRVFMIAEGNGKFLRTYNPPAEKDCSRPAGTSAERLPGSDSSRIIVHTAAADIALSAPVARIGSIRRHYSPMAGIHGDEVMVAWRTPRSETDTVLSMRAWYPSLRAPSDSVFSLAFSAQLPASGNGYNHYWHRRQDAIVMSGDSLLLSSSYSRADGRIFPGGTESREWSAVHRLYAAGPAGWRLAVERGESSQSFTGLGVPHVAYGADASGSGMISIVGVPYGSGEGTTQTVTGYDTAWNASWSMESALTLRGNPALLLPLGEKECVVVAGGVGMHVRDGKLAGRFELDNPKSWSLYHPLRDGTFFRIRAADTSGLRYEIARYSPGGEMLRSSPLLFRRKPAGMAMAQSREDSTIAVVYGGDSGVRGIFLEPRSLRTLLADTAISATKGVVRSPAARFRHDTLMVVWEDHRTGEPEIYGTPFPMPEWKENTSGAFINGDRNRAAGGARILVHGVRYGAAGRRAHVEYSIPEAAGVHLALFDMLGASALPAIRQDAVAGHNAIDIDLGSLAAGPYLLVLSVPGGLSATFPLIVRQ